MIYCNNQIAGLKVFTTASSHHHESLKALGADFVFNYKDPEVSKKIKEASGGKIKISLDGISEHGSTELVAESLSDEGGKIVTLCGFLLLSSIALSLAEMHRCSGIQSKASSCWCGGGTDSHLFCP